MGTECLLPTRLDVAGLAELADTLGDTPHTIMATQLLRRALCQAHVTGTPQRFEGAIIQARDFPGEPTGYGVDHHALWALLQSIEGWFCILVSTECAPALGERMEAELGVHVRYLDDICCAMPGFAPAHAHEAVRLLTLDDLDLLEAAHREFRASCYANTRDLLTNGIVACAIVDGKVAATALTGARSARYAEVGVFTQEGHRGQGLATAAAALVCAQVQSESQQPVWSAGAHNTPSLRVAEKLGFVEIGRKTYAIVVEQEIDRSQA